jgi:RNA polymerase sigma-70 factor, ECF subfamily
MSLSTTTAVNLEQWVTSGFAARAIRQKAKQLAGRSGFSLSEQEDIEQELRLHLLRRLSKFDPHVAPWNVFVRTLVERHTATLVAQRRTRIRATDNVQPCVASQEASLDIVLDTETVLAELPCRARELCERLKNDTVAEVARQMGVPRSTLRDDIARLRKHFQTMGLTHFSESVRHFAVAASR